MKAKYHFTEYKNRNLISYYDKENVVVLFIFKSGWHEVYQCILEWGEYEASEHYLLTAQQIEKYYGIKTFSRKEKLIKINESLV